MMSQRKARAYDKEFKLNAVKLYLTSGKPYEEVSNKLGIPVGTLVTWVKGYKQDGVEAFPGKGYAKPSDIEVMNLRKELAIVREERDILKKALGIFSSQRK
jgi:transposase-like protein